MNKNKLTWIEPKLFLNQLKIVKLDLSENRIRELQSETFTYLVNLNKELSLCSNKLTQIDPKLFENSFKLEKLSLLNNQIEE